ncbi:MAG: transporter substrate-binding domain-containing protein [Thermodesulfobacteriota bacterium]
MMNRKKRGKVAGGLLGTLIIIFDLLMPFLALPAAALPPAAKPPISSAAESDYPPFSIVDADGGASGFSVELLRATLAAMDREVVFRTGPWPEVRGWLEKGEVEALPLVGRTPERESLFDFTFPYMTLHGAIVVRKQTTDIHELSDLRGRRVAVMQGDNAEEFMRREDRGAILHSAPSFEQALRELDQGRHDAVVVQRLVALRLIHEAGFDNLRIVGKPIEEFQQDFCFAVREGDRDTLALLNEGLALVMADGTYRALHAKWFARLELPDNRRLVIGGDHNYPPYEYLDEEGRPAGYNVDLTRAIALETGLDVEIRLGPWPEIRQALARGEIDAVQGMFYSIERDKTFDFTPPHTINHCISVVRVGTAPPVTLAELSGKRIVVEQGDIMHDFLEEQGLGDQAVAVATQEEALRQLAAGEHDCALVSRLTARYWITRHGWDNLRLGRKPFLSPGYCYAVPQGHQALLTQLAEGLKILDENGQYRRIYEKWMGVYEESETEWRSILLHVAMGALPLLFVLLVVFLWSWSLRRQVAAKTRELRESTELQRAMVACSPMAIFSIDTAGRVTSWNASAERMFGWTVDEAVGKPLPIVPEEKQEEFAALRKRVDAGEILVAVEVVRCKKDGSLFDGSLSAAPIRDAEGHLIGIMGVMEDITRRKESERALAESEERFRRAIVEAPFPIMIHAEDGEILVLSRVWRKLTGYVDEKLTTMAEWTALAYGEKSEEVRKVIARTYSCAERVVEGAFAVTCKDGCRRIWDFSSTPLGRLADGRRVVISMAADITGIKEAQDRISHLNNVLRAIRDVNQLIVHERDSQALIRAGCRLLVENRGYASALIVLTDENDHPFFWASAGLAASSATLETLLEQGGLPPCCRRFLSERGSVVVTGRREECSRCPVGAEKCRLDTQTLCVRLVHRDELFGYLIADLGDDLLIDDEEQGLFAEIAGDLAYALKTLRMDEERKKAEEKRLSLEKQLVQAQKMESVGRLAGGVAHDYNNMLSVIIGYAELVLEKIGEKDALRDDIKEILAAARRSADITRQLLAFARRQIAEPRVLDLNETVEGMLKMLRRLIGEDIELAWHPAPALWSVRIDPTQIDQILANLCVNARDAIADVGKITIETDMAVFDESYCADHAGFVPGDFVMLAVSDDGCGMDRELVEKIFEPFFTTKKEGRGTGLGLATVYGIVKQNEGFVNVYSEPGRGSTFKIYLPRHSAGGVSDERAAIVEEILPGQGEWILVVEDEELILKLAERILVSLGYRVLLAGSPTEALRLVEQTTEKITLLITDVVMPGMNGRELAERLQALSPDLRCLFMSGYTANVIAHHGILDEGVNFIQKPFAKKDLARKVRSVLARERPSIL